ncbi:MAG: dTMP kinase [Gemmatales bacterium]|nr:dTMP kinase [Gemmatales bacterium]MDW8387458.1 dTMP kinase [Gemmatales bacterium]
MSRGLFISLDGPDGAGKSTQCRLLAEWLRERGCPVVLCRDPGGTAVGERIRELLLDRDCHMSVTCEAFLYMASRAQLVDEVIRPALVEGKFVVSDRFLLANVVYQGHAGGLSPEKLWELGRLAVGSCLPDLTLVLDVEPEVSSARKPGPKDRMECRGPDFAWKVRQGFLAEAQRDPERIRVIPAQGSIAEVAGRIRDEVARVLAKHSRP